MKKRAKLKNKFDDNEKESDCILHGYIKKLGGPFSTAWQTRYAKLYPNRLELHSDNNSSRPEVCFFLFFLIFQKKINFSFSFIENS